MVASFNISRSPTHPVPPALAFRNFHRRRSSFFRSPLNSRVLRNSLPLNVTPRPALPFKETGEDPSLQSFLPPDRRPNPLPCPRRDAAFSHFVRYVFVLSYLYSLCVRASFYGVINDNNNNNNSPNNNRSFTYLYLRKPTLHIEPFLSCSMTGAAEGL